MRTPNTHTGAEPTPAPASAVTVPARFWLRVGRRIITGERGRVRVTDQDGRELFSGTGDDAQALGLALRSIGLIAAEAARA